MADDGAPSERPEPWSRLRLRPRVFAPLIALGEGVLTPSLSSPDPLARALAEAQLHAPGYTLRGGTNEILRGVVARGLGVR